MQERKLFEYAVIRVMPRVERGEFMNVGVVLYCASQKFLQVRFIINGSRLTACCADVDLAELEKRLHVFDRICQGDKAAGPIALLPIASRFRWLTATKSTVVQTSAVHPGLCIDPETEIDKLFKKLVE